MTRLAFVLLVFGISILFGDVRPASAQFWKTAEDIIINLNGENNYRVTLRARKRN